MVVVASRERPLSGEDRAVLEALVGGFGAAVERVQLEAEARNARIAAAVGRTRSGFLSAVSHNLRTPLASIKAAVSTLLDPDAELARPDERDLLETIYGETDRLERLVTKVLNLSRIRAGGLELDPHPADIAGLAEAAIRRLRPIAGGHVVRVEVPPDLAEVDLDVTMVEQVFLNLLENSLRFAPAGSEIRIQAAQADGEVEVRVSDRGPGIPEDRRERVFEEFVRGDARDESPGTGLGLAIVRAMVSAHHGRVWCEETPGGGATVVFRLPLGLRTTRR
jgi:two-component system sensor histidine kinase KdpD